MNAETEQVAIAKEVYNWFKIKGCVRMNESELKQKGPEV